LIVAAGNHEVVRVLSLRAREVGGDVRAAVRDEDLQAVREALDAGTGRGLVLLIHGYNNDYAAALRSYDAFFELQHGLAQLPEHRPLADNRVFVELYWPGDADWGIASVLFYMGAVANARVCAERFAPAIAALAERGEPLAVEIVGHSLGCRVAFELIKRLRAAPNVNIDRVVVMAAAVPTFMLESPADPKCLRPAYDQAVAAAGGAGMSLYSGADPVLAFAFPLGQTVASGDEGFLPTALGHAEWHCASMPVGFEQREVAGASHSDYWGGEADTRAIALDAQRRVRDFLRFDGAGPRDTATRGLVALAGVPERQTAAPRRTPSAAEFG
jgi:pimeloyl-ACP methyl ester carboxylesterase